MVSINVIIIMDLWLMVLESGLVNIRLKVSILVVVESDKLLFVGEIVKFCDNNGRIGCM